MAGHIEGTTHLCQGQEGLGGSNRAMRSDDVITKQVSRATGTPSHEVWIQSVALAEMMSRLHRRLGGVGGSMHLSTFGMGNIGLDAIVGAGLADCHQRGESFKIRGRITGGSHFFGDGATNIGHLQLVP